MSEIPDYQLHDPITHPELYTQAAEIHELTTDVKHIGAAALLSEVQAHQVVGSKPDVEVPDPSSTYVEKRSLKNRFGAGKAQVEQDRAEVEKQNAEIEELKEDLVRAGNDDMAVQGEDPIRNSAGLDVFRKYTGERENREHILDSADLPPIFRVSKEHTAMQNGQKPEEFSWYDWFKNTSDEELTNFAQWYTEKVKVLSDPETKAAHVESLKNDYKGRIHQAMSEGWVDSKHAKTLDERIAKSDIRFFSPFGTIPATTIGSNNEKENLIILPTIANESTTLHELGHSFAGINPERMRGYLNKTIGKKQTDENINTVGHVWTMLDEGFNEHMTAALIDGSPTVVRPKEREQRGISHSHEESEAYQSFRDVFGMLVEGDEGNASTEDIKEVVSTMVEDDFDGFAKYLSRKWGGRDVISEVFKVVAENDKYAHERGSDSVRYGAVPTGLIAERLRDAKHDERALAVTDEAA